MQCEHNEVEATFQTVVDKHGPYGDYRFGTCYIPDFWTCTECGEEIVVEVVDPAAMV